MTLDRSDDRLLLCAPHFELDIGNEWAFGDEFGIVFDDFNSFGDFKLDPFCTHSNPFMVVKNYAGDITLEV